MYRTTHSFENRKAEALKIRSKYPNRIPIIVEPSQGGGSKLPEIDKQKYLVPSDLTMGQFQYVVRKRIKLNAETALFMFINDKIVSSSQLLSNIYEDNKDDDAFLYVIYSGENTFGA
jgi:GABA(A) receptor-associated protein